MKPVLCLLLLMGFSNSIAQEKSFSLEQLIPGGKGYTQLRPKTMSYPAWMGDKLIFSEGKNAIIYSNKGSKRKEPLLTLGQLNKALKSNDVDTLKALPRLLFDTDFDNTTYFKANDAWMWYDIKNKKISQAIATTKGDFGFDFNPSQNFLALNNGKSLFVVDNNGERVDISNLNPGNNDAIVWGQSVHRNEFGIHKGTFWSPNGKLLAFYRMDESMVTEYPIVNMSARVAKEEAIRYPMAGMDSHQVTIGIYNTETKEISYLNTGAPLDRYFTNIAWTPDSKSIIIAELNRAQNEMEMVRYDVASGDLMATLFTEKHDKYVEPESPVMFLPNNDEQFVWTSKKDGYNHIYLYDKDGKELKQLTSGNWVVKDIVKISPKGDYIYYTSTEVNPTETHLYRVNVKTGKREGLTTDARGVHSVAINPSATYFYDRYSSKNVPNVERISASNGKNDVVLMESENPLAEYNRPEIEVGTIKAADGVTDLYYRLTKPVDYDPNKKYPAIIYLYNGPHAQLVTDTWLAGVGGWDMYMAQKGYVMLTLDGRGSANRGQDFEQVIHRNVGVEEGKDQMQGVELLESLGYVDMDRIGIHGWSYGGFMTTHMMLTYPEVFKVGAAGGPVMDWSLYEVMYGERYMGHPEDNKEGYASTSLLPKAKNLEGRLLIIHGDIDPVVVMQHSLKFLKQSVQDGVYPDYFVYTGHEHNVIGKDRVHLYEKITRYFDDFLQ